MVFAAKISEVPNFGKKVVSLDGLELLLVNIKGAIHACENECPHQGSPMTGAIVKENHISCPRHGFRFNLTDGECLDRPDLNLKIFPVLLDGDDIMVDPG
jgi:nitrite reductase/ring-hydroxylating ferredoxin subunit